MRWPWASVEERAQPYTDAIVAALSQAAEGSAATASATAALEAAAGLYARAFATAKVTPRSAVTSALTPLTLADMARRLVAHGEAVYYIEVVGAAVALRQASAWDITGMNEPSTWMYRLNFAGPSTESTRSRVPAASVIHVRYATDAARPWAGISPLGFAAASGRLMGAVEAALADEAATPHGNILPLPVSGDDDRLSEIRASIRTLNGRVMLPETTAGAWTGDPSNAPRRDWQPVRLGAQPPESMVDLRNAAARAVLAACGVPVDLVEPSQGTAARESFRRFLHAGVAPLARIVEGELRAKLERPRLTLSFEELNASDVSGRARAYGSLVAANYPPALAAAVAGVPAPPAGNPAQPDEGEPDGGGADA